MVMQMINVQEQTFILEKSEMLPMRDGVKLATDIYRPLGDQPAPVLLARMPYNKERTATVLSFPMDRLLQAGYVVVLQDQRGRYASEGEFIQPQYEPADGVDTIAWITQQPWCNGKVGMFGASPLGEAQWQVGKEQPSALLALAPMHCRHRPYHHHGGAFELGLWLAWSFMQGGLGEMRRLISQGHAVQEDLAVLASIEANLAAQLEHLPLLDIPLLEKLAPYYFNWLRNTTQEAAQRMQAQEAVYENILVPVLNIGGWYDLFLDGVVESYQQMKLHGGSEAARKFQHLVIGPWAHFDLPGVFPEHNYGPVANTRDADLAGMHIRWFDQWLKDSDNGVKQEKPVHIFIMGADIWRDEEDWPLPDTRYTRYYLHSQGHANTLTGDGLLSCQEPAEEPEDVYSYDPLHPVPTLGGPNLLNIDGGFTLLAGTPRHGPYLFNAGPRDQSEIEQREDVLCYTTPPLERSVEVTGPLELVLSISSSALDTDFTGKLVDVYPDGRAEILNDGILRARYRESPATPVLMEPGKICELRIRLGSTANVFKAGHRLRLEVSSSNFPRFDRNTNTGGNIITERAEDLRSAINRVYHDQAHPSYLILPLIERESD